MCDISDCRIYMYLCVYISVSIWFIWVFFVWRCIWFYLYFNIECLYNVYVFCVYSCICLFLAVFVYMCALLQVCVSVFMFVEKYFFKDGGRHKRLQSFLPSSLRLLILLFFINFIFIVYKYTFLFYSCSKKAHKNYVDWCRWAIN